MKPVFRIAFYGLIFASLMLGVSSFAAPPERNVPAHFSQTPLTCFEQGTRFVEKLKEPGVQIRFAVCEVFSESRSFENFWKAYKLTSRDHS